MATVRNVLVAAVIAMGLTVAGCGGSGSRSSSSSTARSGGQPLGSSAGASPAAQQPRGQPEPLPTKSIDVSIPTLHREGEDYIPRRYTCDGADVPLPVRWSGIPAGPAELAMFVVNLLPVQGHLFFDWAVAGLNPTSHGISPGTLPPGAIIGRNTFGNVGYSICPPRGPREEHFIVRVFALARTIRAKTGFDAETLFHEAQRSPRAAGGTSGVYSRP
jgi:phosphatidylethanolamine-binding protein (PEBP) family uncharacterized protein